MRRLLCAVKSEVKKEYERASEKFGPVNNSDHESYALLLEELQEAQVESEYSQTALNDFWLWVKQDHTDDVKLEDLDRLEDVAIRAACEFIQVAALAYKAQITIKSRKG